MSLLILAISLVVILLIKQEVRVLRGCDRKDVKVLRDHQLVIGVQ
jgi:hypothetical protein